MRLLNQMLQSILILLCVTVACAQEQPDLGRRPTKLEAFQSRTGVVLIQGYSSIGFLQGTYGGHVEVHAREYRDGSNPKVPISTGISITVKEDSGRTNTSYVDIDEIESLVQGIEYISKATKEVTSLDFFEARYSTKGELRVTVFNDSKETMALISSGTIGQTHVSLKLAQTDKLRDLILAAKAKL